MLQIQNICKEYRTGDLIQNALSGVSLNLRDNEFVSILGPSGSGKTTLLNIIGGLVRYDSGDLIINNVSTVEYQDRDWDSYRNHTIGFVFQSFHLINSLSVTDNVMLPLLYRNMKGKERNRLVAEALEKVGLSHRINHRPSQLSGGQCQRVAIARAIVGSPEIILADEPCGNLDSKMSADIMDLLQRLNKEHGKTVVMVTHNEEQARQTDRIIRFFDGRQVV